MISSLGETAVDEGVVGRADDFAAKLSVQARDEQQNRFQGMPST